MTRKSLVPDSFQLAGIKWTVVHVPEMTDMGKCDRVKARISLAAELDEQIKYATFCHELVHAIKFAMGEHVEPHDEKEVDAFSAFLHQYLTSRT